MDEYNESIKRAQQISVDEDMDFLLMNQAENLIYLTSYSLGLEVRKLPSIAPDDDTPLVLGIICTIEPGIYDFNIGAFRIEDTIVVTKTGYEYLINSPQELHVC